MQISWRGGGWGGAQRRTPDPKVRKQTDGKAKTKRERRTAAKAEKQQKQRAERQKHKKQKSSRSRKAAKAEKQQKQKSNKSKKAAEAETQQKQNPKNKYKTMKKHEKKTPLPWKPWLDSSPLKESISRPNRRTSCRVQATLKRPTEEALWVTSSCTSLMKPIEASNGENVAWGCFSDPFQDPIAQWSTQLDCRDASNEAEPFSRFPLGSKME